MIKEKNRNNTSLRGAFKRLKQLFGGKSVKAILVDASAMGYEKIIEFLQETSKKIIIIPIVNKEMDNLQQYKGEDVSKYNARRFLAMAAEDKDKSFIYENFESEFIDPDDQIQDYVVQNKDRVILVTSDKRLTNNCRAMGVECIYLTQNSELKTRGRRISTFYNAKYQDGQLYLINTNPVTAFMVKHGVGVFQTVEPCIPYELHVGDEILLCRSKRDKSTEKPYVAFSHYEVINISERNNITTLYTHRFYDNSEVHGLWNPIYRSFINEYMAEHFTNGEMCNTMNKKEFLQSIHS
jgi:rRNA-processing protein FCF1